MIGNKYEKMFNENMSSLEVMNQYYGLYDGAKGKGEIELLEEAYYHAAQIATREELNEASKGTMC
mgnify:CR=1 FL=1